MKFLQKTNIFFYWKEVTGEEWTLEALHTHIVPWLIWFFFLFLDLVNQICLNYQFSEIKKNVSADCCLLALAADFSFEGIYLLLPQVLEFRSWWQGYQEKSLLPLISTATSVWTIRWGYNQYACERPPCQPESCCVWWQPLIHPSRGLEKYVAGG